MLTNLALVTSLTCVSFKKYLKNISCTQLQTAKQYWKYKLCRIPVIAQ